MEDINIIRKPVVEDYKLFNDDFLNSLSSSTLLLQTAIERIMQSTGKHVRPLLTLLAAKACGRVTATTVNSAVLLELLHTASLVHDDVIDETKQRRGVPSLNAFFDNRVSVLVGDYLLSSALIRSVQTGNINIMYIVSNVGRALAEGEIKQLEIADDAVLSEASYMDVIEKKTAVLLSACAEIGAISAGASDREIELLRMAGACFGYCFQLRDDVFDYFDNAEIGKPTGNDIIDGKVTLPLLYALENSRDEVAVASFKRMIAEKDYVHDNIDALIDFAKINGGIDYAEKRMLDYRNRAVDLLLQLPESEARESLVMLADFIVGRNH
ncbi:MAG: polyprenyl synthetase family protein [Tannerellaceae bacterium]|jgi:octaprenyl-diphosphate synthase|nr:polyprenyl synthetase family protein [Tannerellaceae bacterium]